MNLCKTLLLASAALLIAVSASAQTITETIDGQSFTSAGIFQTFDPTLGKNVWIIAAASFTSTHGDSLSISGEVNPDPILSFAVSATDVGTPSTFAVTIGGIPIVPTGPVVNVDGSVSYSLTDGTLKRNGVSLVPGYDGGTATVQYLGNGVDLGVDVGPGASFPKGPPNSHVAGSPTPGFESTSVVNGTITDVSAQLKFDGSGGGDTYGITGQVSLDGSGSGFGPPGVVPEPSSLALFLPGLLGLGFLKRRRKAVVA